MILKDISFPDALDNILFDEVLLELAEQGRSGEVLRLWESPRYFIVLGRNGEAQEDVDLESAARDQVVVLRRCSGGGTVLQGPGCLNFSLILKKENDPALFNIPRSYQFVLGKIILALRELGVSAEYRPISDLVTGPKEQKFSGNAQRRRKNFILHHGTILYCFDLGRVGCYLKTPKQAPAYRRGRAHEDFLVNIPLRRDRFCQAIQKDFGIDATTADITPEEMTSLQELRRSTACLTLHDGEPKGCPDSETEKREILWD